MLGVALLMIAPPVSMARPPLGGHAVGSEWPARLASPLAPSVFSGSFGSGAEGDHTVASGQTLYVDSTRSALAASAAPGQNQVTLSDSGGFQVGQAVLLIQMRGAGVGNYEFRPVAAVNGDVLTLEDTLQHAYTVGGGSLAQAIRVPQYRRLTVEAGGLVTASPWNGASGGVVALLVREALTVTGQIVATGLGWRGGSAGTYNAAVRSQGWQGESYGGTGSQTRNSNGAGGGGGEGDNNSGCPSDGKCGGAGGGGGGYGVAGATGGPGGDKPAQPGLAGASIGSSSLSPLYPGSGGGGGGSDDSENGPGGAGGSGGGIILIAARQIVVNGSLLNNGAGGQGGASNYRTGGGGGGSGGAILLAGADVTLAGTISALGGGAGPGYNDGGAGGAGGSGRIAVQYCNTQSGATNPAASSTQTTCPPLVADTLVTSFDGPPTLTVGLPHLFTTTVTNLGPDPALGVVLTNVVQGAAWGGPGAISQGNCSAGAVVVCTAGQVTAGASVTFTRALTPSAAGWLTNTLSVSSTENDPSDANNAAQIARWAESNVTAHWLYLPVALRNYFFGSPSVFELEPNNTLAQANGPLEAGRAYQGYPNDANDFYYFQTVGGALAASLESVSGMGTQLQLFYEDTNALVGYAGGPPYQIILTNQPAGWYYVRVYTAGGHNDSTPYTLRVTYP